MRSYVLLLTLLVSMLLPCHAGQREDALIEGLLGLGGRALQEQAEQRRAEREGQGEGAGGAAGASAEGVFSGSLRQSLDGFLDEYKEQYKEEGRAYARELGDMVVERVVQDPEIHASLTSLRSLCWGVVAYLTLVTLVMLTCLLYLRRANARLLAAVQAMRREMKRG